MYLDRAAAMELVDGDMEIYMSLLETFIEAYEKDAAEIERLKPLFDSNAEAVLSDGDLRENVRKTAHKIKGGSYTIGANILGDSAKNIEKFLVEPSNIKTPANIELLNGFLAKFKENYFNTLKEIKTVIA
ncbi:MULTISPECIES: Hpt domain-containing protein [unclassified Treponema]|uniref:Hpt domain-containing protein n=1 Tax=unclassified Treponema TaxID=2638727 RepID=UPI0020A3D25B|nr:MULTISPECIES: Hpt domain-containing protein [unclassified Treponema]UTC66165.1 Hpt domain-containing protein [Treponema sp. OMZ 789]UTC68894.1 Hpt domain-containing protein [Treponema sp. OMZ 790]UTC71622.1 Hpt domain-containing protein [Treponema sp. OMZ 791]